MHKIPTRLLITASLISTLLGGCEFMDGIGRHMPVIGERCEYWQCFTGEGQARSKAKTRMYDAKEEAERHPLNGADNPSAVMAPAPTAPGMAPPPDPTAARTPAEPTPFDMTPEQLQGAAPNSSE